MANEESERFNHPPKLAVFITQEAIERAKRRDSGHCMIAEAIREKLPDASYVAVDLQTIRFTRMKNQKRYVYLTPRIAQLALIAFDQGRDPLPFGFRLRNGQTLPVSKNSEEQRARKREYNAEYQRQWRNNKKKKPNFKISGYQNTGNAPNIEGGKPPPIAPGRRRAFGLRALQL